MATARTCSSVTVTWISDRLLARTIDVWSRAYDRPVTPQEAMEILMNVKRFAELLNQPPKDHPTLRWRECDLEAAIVEHLKAFRFPSEELAAWFREALGAVFADREQVERHSRRSLNKRRTELANMQERLLNTYLAGTIDEATFTAKSAELKGQQGDVDRQLASLPQMAGDGAETVLQAFDISQNLVEIWRGSNSAVRRELLDCVSLNRSLSDVSLYLEKRKPFDFFAKQPFLKNSRGERIRTSDFLLPKQAR